MRKYSMVKLLLLFVVTICTKLLIAQVDSISIGDLLKKNKIESITVIDSSLIQFHLKDTLINGFLYFESEFHDSTIKLIENRQKEVFGSVRITPYFLSSNDASYWLSWIIPIFFLLIVWIPGILAIIYFIKKNTRLEIKFVVIFILIIIPISGIVIYPLRKKIVMPKNK